MLVSNSLGNLSLVIFSVLSIAYLMLFELGNKKIKHALLPFIIVLIVIFFVIAALNIFEVYSKIG